VEYYYKFGAPILVEHPEWTLATTMEELKRLKNSI